MTDLPDKRALAKTDTSGGMTFQSQEIVLGQRIGLRTDSSSTQVIQASIDALAKVPGDLTSILSTLFGGDAAKQPYGYDPSVDWLTGISLIYGVVTFDVLLVDGQFYGLLVKIGKKGPPPPAAEQPFAGLGLEILYRKVNDHLGEFSADLTLPSKYRKITFGEAPAATVVTLPAVGLAIWTNGDFKVSIGWPLGDRSFSITFPPDPIPWSGGGGLYFAKLRSEDAPGLGVGFDTILQFGIALRIGAATEGNYSVLKWGASLYLFGSFQGFLAWKAGHPISGGVDYYWFCATVGIQGHLEGTVDFKIIKITLSLDVTASATLALETDHSATAQVEFKAVVKASVKIIFFTVSFSFTLDVQTQIQFGSGPPSKITGPSPPSQLAARALPVLDVAAVVVPAAPSAAPPITLEAHLLLQPSVRHDAESGAWKPVAVATLVLDRPPTDASGAGDDGFSQLAASLARFVFAVYGGYADPAQPVTPAQVTAVLAAIDAGRLDLAALYTWMDQSEVSFAISGVTASDREADAVTAVTLPLIPGLQLTYDGVTTTFGDAAAPAGYGQTLDDYFAKLSYIGDGQLSGADARMLAEGAPPDSASWFPGLLFTDAYNVVAKQLVQDIGALPVPVPLAAGLEAIGVGNLAGTLSRFLQNGVRLPDPAGTGPVESMPTLGLYELTGQQLDVADDEQGHPILTAQLAVGTAKRTVISGDGVSALPFALDAPPQPGPLWAPAPLERIQQVPVSYLLRDGIGWAQQTGPSATKQWLLLDFPAPLQSALRLTSPLTLALSRTDGTTAQPVEGVEGLLLRFSLSPVPAEGAGDALAGKVFKVAGPDEATRDLLELFLASGDAASSRLDLLLPTKDGGSYVTSTADANAILLRTDLSTAGSPALSGIFADALQSERSGVPIPALGPTSAPVSRTEDFLRLLWECSVVHSAGFYLYVPDLDVSSGALSYDVAVLASATSAAPTARLSVDAQHTTIMLAAADVPAADRVQADLFAADGVTAVTEPQPGYPAGGLAFQATWTASDTPPVPSAAVAADTAAYASALYQLLEFKLPGDDVIEPSAWSMALGPDGDETRWSYRRAVPVQRFVKGQPAVPNRYAAIGHPTTVDLQLLDVFGNAMPLPSMTMTAVYNDPLVGLDEWPGATTTYAFTAGVAGSATLSIDVAFDPDDVEQKATALIAYQTIYDQLTDARTSLTVTTAMAADAVPVTAVGSGLAAKPALAAFVAQVMASLAPSVPAPAPATLSLSGTVATAHAASIGEDMFPIWVTAELTRDAPVEAHPYPYPPGYLATATQVPLRLDPASASPEAALREWATGFEASFAGFDGHGALLKVLAGSPPTKVSATQSRLGATPAADVPSVPGNVWALRWSPTAGVDVAFPNAGAPPAGAPVYFTAMPLSTKLVSGPADIYAYDANGVRAPQPTPTTYAGVDLDGWASGFLTAFDTLLAPDVAAAIARLNPDQYAALMAAKEDVAFAVAAGVSWVFADQLGTRAGDLAAAQTCLRESLLTSLGADFSTSAIVQVPAQVAVHGPFEAGDAPTRPPELFGSPTPLVPGDVSPETLEQYTISSAALPVVDGASALTFLVSSASPTTRADLDLGFEYDIGFLDHAFQTSEEQFGYVPSSWLRFVVPDVDPGQPPTTALNVAMGDLDIPIPLRAFPAPPRLVRQAADADHTPPASVTEAVEFTYALTVASPGVAQDDLHLSLLFNGASAAGLTATPATALFGPLARFQDFAAQYLATALGAIVSGAPSAAQWCTDVLEQVQEVAAAWLGGSAEAFAAPAPGVSPPPLPFTWELRLRVPDESKPGVLVLDWIGDDAAPAWPLIEGVAGTPVTATRMQYTLGAGADLVEPTLAWKGLSAITAQSIGASAWIVRNETLAGGGQDRATNPDLVYSTATVTFPDAVHPLLQVLEPLPLASSSVTDAVSKLVSGVMQPTTPDAQVGWALETSYEFALLSGGPGELRTRLPAFLARASLTTATVPPVGVETVASLTAAIVGELKAWYAAVAPSGANASLVFALTVFAADGDQPLVRLPEIVAPISSAAWWNA